MHSFALRYEQLIAWIVSACPALDKFAHTYAGLKGLAQDIAVTVNNSDEATLAFRRWWAEHQPETRWAHFAVARSLHDRYLARLLA